MIVTIEEIDKKATFKAVEKAFEQYRLYRFCEMEMQQPAVVQSYEPRLHGATNVTSDPTASTAIKNAQTVEMLLYCKRIETIVSKLHPMERLIIEKRYMTEYTKDYQVYNFIFNPPISEKTYRKIRWNAVRRVANALGILRFRPKKDGKNPV
ncbi:ArpU family phage packaging/lysis transcriptional regulator [Paenibacillus dendritiformis]|uniref:ArpU family phage packaging/lysis transcriptional regulator n=1 Tax=Paenibacillus dendritiformis TaxID=130049 RepID=UPI00364B8115